MKGVMAGSPGMGRKARSVRAELVVGWAVRRAMRLVPRVARTSAGCAARSVRTERRRSALVSGVCTVRGSVRVARARMEGQECDMKRIESIAVLLHPLQRDAMAMHYRIWPIVANWRAMGVRVDVVYGVVGNERVLREADVLVPHVDCSYLPDEVWEVVRAHPRVVNGRVRDIRKTVVSSNLVRPGDVWDGPVILKTVGNCGGLSDHRFGRMGGPTLFERARHRLTFDARREPKLMRYARTLTRYYLFERVSDVPSGVWANEHLVVERFLPERDSDGNFVMRMWIVMGGAEVGRVLRGSDPYVKNVNAALEEFDEPPAAVEAWRRKFGLDYGKIDFVIHDGEAVIIDANTTPTVSGDAHSEKYVKQCEPLARAGLAMFT